MIAFARAGAGGLEVMQADGSARKLLTAEPGAGDGFAWSPDSRTIAFRAVPEKERTKLGVIKLVSVATGKTQSLSEPAREVCLPQWSLGTKGARLSFMVSTQRVNTAWQKLESSLPPGSREDTGQLVFYAQGNVWSCSGDGADRRQLTQDGGLNPVWSPDRTNIVYSQGDALMIMENDGSKKRELVRGHHPSWSPDGRMLVYDVPQDDGHRILGSDLYVINADGTEPSRLTNTPEVLECDPAWSPDGKRIAYRTEDTGQIWVLWLE
jgi:Tol biopolymer transport system component